MPEFIDRELSTEDRFANQNEYVGAPSFFETFQKQVGVNVAELTEMALSSQAQADRRDADFLASIGQTKDPLISPDQLNKMLGTKQFSTSMRLSTATGLLESTRRQDRYKNIVAEYQGGKAFGISTPQLLGDVAGQFLPTNLAINIGTGGSVGGVTKLAKYSKIFLQNLGGNALYEMGLQQASKESGMDRPLSESIQSAALGSVFGTAIHAPLSKVGQYFSKPKTPIQRFSDLVKENGGKLEGSDFVKSEVHSDATITAAGVLAENDYSPNLDRIIEAQKPLDITVKSGATTELDFKANNPRPTDGKSVFVALGTDVIDTEPKANIKDAAVIATTTPNAVVGEFKAWQWEPSKGFEPSGEDVAILIKDKDSLRVAMASPDTVYGKNAKVAMIPLEEAERLIENSKREFPDQPNGDRDGYFITEEDSIIQHGEIQDVTKVSRLDEPVSNDNLSNELSEIIKPENKLHWNEKAFKAFEVESEDFAPADTREVEAYIESELAVMEEKAASGFISPDESSALKAVKEYDSINKAYEKVFKAFTFCFSKGNKF